jgi:CRISPR/Cas system-associated exonuclease Cas4 (RecB family)
MSRSISYSEISTAQTCTARWDMHYGGRLAGSALRPRLITPQLSAGRAFGAAAAAYHSAETPGLAAMEAHGALEASLEADFDAMREMGLPVIVGDLVDARAKLEPILVDYLERTKRVALTRLEGQLDVALPSRSGKRASSLYRFEGRIDGYATDEHDHSWVVEFKLRKKLTPAWLIALQPQTKWYAWALGREHGSFPIGVLVEERFADAPHPARILKSGQPSGDRAQLTTGALYRDACERTGAEVNHELAAHFESRKWQQRVPILFRPGELENAGRELVSAAKLIRDLDSGELWPIRNASVMHCHGCQYRDICADPMDEAFVDSLYVREEPKRQRRPTVERPSPQLTIYDALGGDR